SRDDTYAVTLHDALPISGRSGRCRRGGRSTPRPRRGRVRPGRRSGAPPAPIAAGRDSRRGLQRGALGGAAGVARLLPVVVEQRRLPAAVGRVGQHPPAAAEPLAMAVEQGLAAGGAVVLDLEEVAELVAELHQHPVPATGQAAAAVLLAAVLLAAGHLQAQA